SRSVVFKIMKLGYYWPSMHNDAKRGIDIVGPMLMAPGGARFLVIAIDYFTKWIEAKPLVITTGKHMEKFIWEHIVGRFGILQIIISNNGKQFAEGIFQSFAKNLERLTKDGWLSYHRYYGHIGQLSSNGKTPFILVYSSKSVVPIEISVETKRIKELEVRQNEKRCREDLDILKERREITSTREAYYKHKLEGYYYKRVQPSTFKPRTYVL
ncbi:reverse transcriptase domain-containing protein, partial [Tanacetum coccineum]